MSAASSSAAVVSSSTDIDCPVCLERFSQPKLLHCGHSLCVVCIGRMLESGGRQRTIGNSYAPNSILKCPTCRQDTFVPAGGLATNYALADLLEQLSTNAGVAAPSGNTAKCTACEKIHEVQQMFVCDQCDDVVTVNLICSHCAVVKHNGHRLTAADKIGDKLKTTKEMITRACQVVSRKHEKIIKENCIFEALYMRESPVFTPLSHQVQELDAIKDKLRVENTQHSLKTLEGMQWRCQTILGNVEKIETRMEKLKGDVHDLLQSSLDDMLNICTNVGERDSTPESDSLFGSNANKRPLIKQANPPPRPCDPPSQRSSTSSPSSAQSSSSVIQFSTPQTPRSLVDARRRLQVRRCVAKNTTPK